ncbi:MAG TPA: hypothetical protein VFZ34_15025 [Blastocatellia bacterium]|nr:hypothetical protein [Blastocatellia bacterium]
MNYPLHISLFLILIVVALVVVIAIALNKLAAMNSAKRSVVYVSVGLLIGWLALMALLAVAGFFRDFQTLPPRIAFGLVPTLLGIVVLSASPRVRHFLFAAPETWLIAYQVYRVPLEIVLWLLFSANLLPVQMTFEGRNFDIVPALLAPFIAWFCFVKKSWSRVIAVIWNVAGFLLVINVATMGLLSAPTPFRVFLNEPSTRFVADFPYIWIPTFLVPLALFGHVMSLLQLLKKR